MKPLKHKGIKPSGEIRLPELKITGVSKRIIDWVSHIRYIYWVIGIIIVLALFLWLMPDYMWNFFRSRIKAQGALVSMVIIFCVVAVSLVWKTGQRIDVWVFRVFNVSGRRLPWIDWIMLGITQMGNGIFAMGIAIIIFLKVDHLLAYEIILGTLTLWLVVELMKIVIRRTRPYIKLKNIRIVGSKAGGHSFPSGHTSQSFYMATLLINYYHVGLFGGLSLYAIALLVGITRIYVGMHYPRDVLGGALLGTSWGLIDMVINNFIR